ncbi:PRC-barrel domain-containing protein [Zhengella sp. ZM62]|uniref:PRC-barrel domain-containing protein n=1 Tax=Zhengella sedimenti TaxID=3390035 RepID=UPI0039761CB4
MLNKLFTTTAMVALMTTGVLAAEQNAAKDMNHAGQPVFSQEAAQDLTSETGYFEAAASQILASNLLGATVYVKASGERGAAMDGQSGYGTDNTTAKQDRVEGEQAAGMTDSNESERAENQAAGMADGERKAENLEGNEAATGQAARQMAMMDNLDSVGDVNDVVMGRGGQAEAVVIGVGGFLGIGEKNVAVDFSKLSWVERNGERWLTISATREELEAAPAFDTETLTAERDTDRDDRQQVSDASGEAMDENARQDRTASGEQMNQTDDREQMAATDDGDVDRETTAAVDREGWTQTQQGEMSAENLLGTSVYGANDEDLGEIGDVIVTADGEVEAYVIDVGGFLGIGEKPVALDASELQVMQNGNGEYRIFTQFTQEQLEQQSAYDEASYASNRDQMLLR